MEEYKTQLPLRGITVIELATVVAAPVVGRLLATYGADVIKVEAPGGDNLRAFAKTHCFPIEDGNAPLFDMYNSGKRYISLNLKTEDGKEAFLKLLERADVFLTNVRYASLARMGLDYESVQERFPRLVYAHFSGFGPRGEEAGRPGFDHTAFWMRSGPLLDCLLPGSFPMRPPFAFGDVASAGNLFSGILMALFAREKNGKGTKVETSLLGCGIFCNASYVLNAQEPYGKKYPYERYEPWDPFSEIYECADGEWVAVLSKNYQKEKAFFAEAFHIPELVNDPEMVDQGEMRAHGKLAWVTQKISEAMIQKTSKEWLDLFAENDIATELLRHFKDVCHDKQAWANGYFEQVEYPDGAKVAMPAPPVEFSAYGKKPFEKSLNIGRDTDEILSEVGYSAAEIAAMHQENAVK